MNFVDKPLISLGGFLALFLGTVHLFAEEPGRSAHPKVAGFERFRDADTVSDLERGLLLINEMNCLSCHDSSSEFWAGVPRKAPVLSEVGRRVQHDYIRKFIKNPHATKPGTTMPNVLVRKSDAERERIADSITHYLAATGRAIHQPTTPAAIRRGQELFHTVGCVACHDPQAESTTYSTSIPLGKLDDKYTLSGLTSFISDPLHVRPSGRMPQFNLSASEYQDIASYLLRDIKIAASFRYDFYEGDWQKLPDFETMKPVKSGIANSFALGNYPRKNGFGLVFTGYLQISEPGKYKFKTSSDDGSRILVDGNKVAEIDGIHPVQSNEGTIELEPGFHKIRIEYFEGAGGEKIECVVSGPGFGQTTLSAVMTLEPVPDPSRVASIEVDLNKAAKGKAHFAEVGCVNCHDMDGVQKLAENLAGAGPVSKLNPGQGCLANAGGSVNFQFDDQQTTALATAIEWLQSREGESIATTANERVHQQLMSMNCYSCHSRETGTRGEDDFKIFGGVVDPTGGDSFEVFGRDKWFVGVEAEMGDEGRHPPYLKAVGAKLNPKWFQHVLENGPKDRPYVKTMMPKFGIDNLPGLIADFQAADRLSEAIEPTQDTSISEIKGHGRFFVGSEGMSCIKCHTFGEFHSTGIPAISLTTMTQRLNKDWFQMYMKKPSRFRRGTRMPESWPDGKSFFPNRLNGDADSQIEAIWEYLADGENAKQPKGLKKTKMEIVADAAPRIYRNFIEGAGSRAIAVGYPERVNLAFDAATCQMKMFWQENFIDGSRHWTGRGQGFEPPLGENILNLPRYVSFFDGDPSTWPVLANRSQAKAAGIQFLGYDLDENLRPIFRYRVGKYRISEFILPETNDSGGCFTRRFQVNGPPGKLLYFAASGTSIKAKAKSFQIDDRLQTQLNGQGTARIENLIDNQALIFEIEVGESGLEFEQKYVW